MFYKRLLAVLLITFISLSVLPVQFSASEVAVTSNGNSLTHGSIGGVTWELLEKNDKRYKLTVSPDESKKGTAEYGCIPDADIDSETEISLMPWMDALSMITEIEIMEGVSRIGDNAFRSTNVYSESGRMILLTLPNSLREIGNYAFYSVKINRMRLGSGLKTIGDYAFSRTQLTELHLPSVESIGEGAFMDSYYIRNATLGDRLSVIPHNAFAGCTYLREVTLSRCVTALYGFANNFQLKDIYYPGTKEDFKDVTATYSYYLHNAAFHYLGNNRVTLSTMTPCVGDTVRYTLDGSIANYPADRLKPCWQIKKYNTWTDLYQGAEYRVTSSDVGYPLRVIIKVASDSGFEVDEALSQSTRAVVAESAPTYDLTLNITSYLDADSRCTIEMIDPDTFVQLYTGITENELYTLPVTEGDYLVRVGKMNHVTRDYTVSVKGDTDLSVQLHPLGDVNGDGNVTPLDVATANNYIKGKKQLSDYALQCGDINGDGEITGIDISKINLHLKGKKLLWE